MGDTVTETSEILFGTTRIAYAVERSARRRKTVAVAVEPDGEVRVRAPLEASEEEIDAIVHKKARWIVERRRRQEDLQPSPGRRELVSGETFLYLGRQYRLKVRPTSAGITVAGIAVAGARADVRLLGGRLDVPVDASLTGTARALDVRERLVRWYRGHASRRLPERVAELWPRVGVEPSGVLIREPRRRWGSCDARGTLRFNWRIVQAPRRLIDYVVVHELVHLVHPEHGREFWSALGEAMPDYEERRESLRRLGRRLVW